MGMRKVWACRDFAVIKVFPKRLDSRLVLLNECNCILGMSATQCSLKIALPMAKHTQNGKVKLQVPECFT